MKVILLILLGYGLSFFSIDTLGYIVLGIVGIFFSIYLITFIAIAIIFGGNIKSINECTLLFLRVRLAVLFGARF